jgi:DNA-binding NtrC family response regulator
VVNSNDDFETVPELPAKTSRDAEGDRSLGMVVLQACDDTEHIGAWISARGTDTERSGVFGRGLAQDRDERLRLRAVRQRPGLNEPLPPFAGPSLSREQLLVREVDTDALELTNVGRLPLVVNDQETSNARARVGDVIEIGSQFVLLVASRPRTLPTDRADARHDFGQADAHGYVGESPAAWRLRSEIACIGRLPGHVLITGATGTGKELVARAFHDLSDRTGPLVARNSATFPDSLADAELFGNLKGYPNPGMPERKGLVGTADGGSLFLDEFAELPHAVQAKLLRVLDSGEYQTLGESVARQSKFRLIAATNKPQASLRADLLARFDLRLRTPSLSERREDLPLIVRHLLVTMTDDQPALRARLFDGRAWPKLGPGFVGSLMRTEFPANVRELRALLWRSVAKTNSDGALMWPPEERSSMSADPSEDVLSEEGRKLERVLKENGGSIEKTWRVLGLSSRFVLMRLLRKHRVAVTRRSAGD